MTLFELVKQTIQVRDAAEHYGFTVGCAAVHSTRTGIPA